MAQDKIYPEGVRVFEPHQSAPDFVVGSIVIAPNELFAWLKKNESLLTEYKGTKQIKLDLLKGNKGLYCTVNTFKPQSGAPANIKADNDQPPF